MKEIIKPSTIAFKQCPKCGEHQSWSVHGFAAGGGDFSKFRCVWCGYRGRPEFKRFKIIIENIE